MFPKDITHVRVDPSVLHIPKNAFQECSALVKVELHNGIRAIGYRAFNSCTALADFDLPDGLQRIRESGHLGVAARCSALTYHPLSLPSKIVHLLVVQH